MKRTLMLSAVSALLLGAAVIPAAASDCAGFLPPNDLSIPVDSPQAKGIVEAQFHEVLDIIQRIYAPIVAADGGKLVINRKWTDATVNASAYQSGGNYYLNMYGGLARHDKVTMDGFALVACHELGHHLGGAPKLSGWSSWASIEGQSDYYANLKCLRQVFSDPAAKWVTTMAEGDEVAIAACEATFADADDRAVCMRGAMAGKSVAYLFQALHNSTVVPSYATPATNVATTMLTTHPPTQCRLDTYLAGSLCTQPVSAAVSDSDVTAGVCTRSGGFTTGFRPLCWYKPANPAELLPPGSRTFGFGLDEEQAPAFNMLKAGLPSYN